MAELQVPAPGSAECVSTHLSHGLYCSHFPKYGDKYGVDNIRNQHRYPSRLGFFHVTTPETRVSFLDTQNLCISCLDLVMPDGFISWSMFSSLKAQTSSKDKPSPDPQATSASRTGWLDATPSSDKYPPLFQAGTENFPQVSPQPRKIAPHLITPPTVISIPQVAGAKEAWQWLQEQRKPFYIDQLHLARGWNPLAEKMAVGDSMIVEESGTVFVPAHQKAEAKAQKSTRKTSSTTNKTTSAKGYVTLISETGEASTAVPIEKSAKKTLSTTKTISMSKSKKDGAVKLPLPQTTARSIYTKNWCRYDPIPFDSPITTLTLAEYARQAEATDHKTESPSHLPLERLLGKKLAPAGNKPVLSGPGSSSGSSKLVSLLAPAGQGERSVAVADSKFMDSLTHESSAKSSLSAKTRSSKTTTRKSPEAKTERTKPTSRESPEAKTSKSKPSGDKTSSQKSLENKAVKDKLAKEIPLEAKHLKDRPTKIKPIKEQIAKHRSANKIPVKERPVRERGVKERAPNDKPAKGNHIGGNYSKKIGSTWDKLYGYTHRKGKHAEGKPPMKIPSVAAGVIGTGAGTGAGVGLMEASQGSSVEYYIHPINVEDEHDNTYSLAPGMSLAGPVPSSVTSSGTSSPTLYHAPSEFVTGVQTDEESVTIDADESFGSDDDADEEHQDPDDDDPITDDELSHSDGEYQISDVSVGQPSDEEEEDDLSNEEYDSQSIEGQDDQSSEEEDDLSNEEYDSQSIEGHHDQSSEEEEDLSNEEYDSQSIEGEDDQSSEEEDDLSNEEYDSQSIEGHHDQSSEEEYDLPNEEYDSQSIEGHHDQSSEEEDDLSSEEYDSQSIGEHDDQFNDEDETSQGESDRNWEHGNWSDNDRFDR